MNSFEGQQNSRRDWLSAAVVITALTVLAVFIWRRDIPLPNISGWDIYAHQTLLNDILKGHLGIFPPQISDTFLVTSYFPAFALLLGAVEYLTRLPYNQVYFLLDTVHFSATVALSAYLGWVATKRRLGALISAILGIFIFEYTVVQVSLFFIPQSLAAVLGIFGVTQVVANKRPGWIFLGLAFIFHFVIGIGALGLGVIAWLIHKVGWNRRGERVILVLGVAALMIGILTNLAEINLDPFQTAESQEFNFTLGQKLELLRNWMGYFLVFYVLGLWSAWRKRDRNLLKIGMLSVFALSAVALFAPYSLKFYALARFLVYAVAAGGIVSLVDRFRPALRYGLVGTLTALLILLFSVNQKLFKEPIGYQDSFTTASVWEMEAATFLKNNYGKDEAVILVSDPATQHVMEALSSVNTQGGSFASEETRKAVDATFPSEDPEQVKAALSSVKDALLKEGPKTILFAVSGRFLVWQNLPDEFRADPTYIIWGPKDITPQGVDYADRLAANGFNKIFQNPAMIVLEFKP